MKTFHCSAAADLKDNQVMQLFRVLSRGTSFVVLLLFLSSLFTIINGHSSSNASKSARRMKSYSQMSPEDTNSCRVRTKLGQIVGKQLKTVLGDPKDTKFCGYRGIRYGKPPVGNLRFKPPVASGPWKGILKAEDYATRCYQFSAIIATVFGQPNLAESEDCLFLNVFTPNSAICDKEIPVLVYIHGGAFTEGDGGDQFYGPNILMNKCVILVTINYRLGTFGFLSLRTANYSGNMGLKDQKLAIKWVKENIASFGGDPNRITVFGESAGGASVGYQTMNAESRKNFKQIFAMSSTPLNYYAQMKSYNHSNLMIDVAKKMGRSISSEKDLIDFLQKADADDIKQQTKHVGGVGFTLDIKWAPIVEYAISSDIVHIPSLLRR